jgi:hypothetical protein
MAAKGLKEALAKMKNNKSLYLFLALLCIWCPLFMGVFDKAKPAASTSLRNSNPEILTNWTDLQTAINQDHEFVDAASGQQSGEHTQVKLFAPISTPTNAANKAWVYSKDVSAVVELHWLDESGNELQMTSGGDLFSSAGLTVTGASTFNGSITLGAGDDLIGSSTSDITFNTNKFTVAGATGNTVIAGTCDITGATEVIGVATLGDASLLKTSAAPTTDAMIANKKYVDDKGANDDGSTVFNTTMTAADTFQDLDLSAQVGTTTALVYLEVSADADTVYVAKPKGFGSATFANHYDTGEASYGGNVIASTQASGKFAYIACMTDTSGVIQHASASNAVTFTIKLVGFIGNDP